MTRRNRGKSMADVARAIKAAPLRRLRRGVTAVAQPVVVWMERRSLLHPVAWRLRAFVNDVPGTIDVYPSVEATNGDRPSALLVAHDLTRSGAPQVLAEIAMLLRHTHAVTLISPCDGPWRRPLVDAGIAVIVDSDALKPNAQLIRRLGSISLFAICNTVVTHPAVETLAGVTHTIWYLHEAAQIANQFTLSPPMQRAVVAADAVWTVSEKGRRLLLPHREDVAVVRYGCRPPKRGASPGSGRPVRMGVFGSIESRKGQDLLLEAYSRLTAATRRELEIVCHGRVLDAAFAADLTERARGVDGFTIENALDAEAYRLAVTSYDGVIAPSRDDPMPIAVSDGLGAGRIVLCTPDCGQADYIATGENGFVCAATDADSVAATIEEAMSRRDEWPMIASKGEALFQELFSIDAFDDRLRQELPTQA